MQPEKSASFLDSKFVHGQDEGNQEEKSEKKPKKKEKKPLTPEQIKKRAEREAVVVNFIDSHKRLFETFAGDTSLRYRPDRTASTFAIAPKTGEVIFPIKWFFRKGYSPEQMVWAGCHELSHFLDMMTDPKSFMEQFDYEKSKGNKKRAYGIFYNIFDDVHVNKRVASKAPTYGSSGSAGKEVTRLYQEKLFPKTDFKSLPRHLQYLYYIMRKTMVPEEEVIVEDDVAKALQKKFRIFGAEFNIDSFLKTMIYPTGGSMEKEKNTPKKRYDLLKRYIEPIFDKLLEQDMADPRFQKKPKPESKEENDDDDDNDEDNDGDAGDEGEGEGGDEGEKNGDEGDKGEGEKGKPGEKNEPGQGGKETEPSEPDFSQFYDDYDSKNPDRISDEDKKDFAEKAKEDKDKKEEEAKKQEEDAKKTPEQKAKEQQAEQNKSFAEKHGIPEAEMKKFERLERSIKPFLEGLSELWRSIIYGHTEEYETSMEGFYKTGIELDLQQVISQWPKIETGRYPEVEAQLRTVENPILHEKPELIRIRLVCDQSGSMDEPKRKVLQQVGLLVMRSLEEFQTYLNWTRQQTKSKLNVDTEVWGFGDSNVKHKAFRAGEDSADYESNRAEIIKTIGALNTNLSGTFDAPVLRKINADISGNEEYLSLLKKGKIMEIIIEITDGGSSNEQDSRDEVNKLAVLEEEAPVIARAIQIGIVSDDDKAIFQRVWGERGQAIGDELGKLLPIVQLLLAKYLGQVRL